MACFDAVQLAQFRREYRQKKFRARIQNFNRFIYLSSPLFYNLK